MPRVVDQLDAEDLAAVRRFLHAHPGEQLPDHLLADLTGAPRPGVRAVLRGDPLSGYAQASSVAGGWQIGAVPELDAAELLDPLLDALAHTGGVATWWTTAPDAAAQAAELGMAPGRRLLVMRTGLPLDGRRSTIETRAFQPGADDDAWLETNNLAFAWHPEQGAWDRRTLQQRMAEPWFDPDGFRILDASPPDPPGIAAFCWTKVHADERPAVGEIYVIGVRPDHHGRGLGSQLTLAGLESIAGRGLDTAILYVDAANEQAVRTYDRLGFTVAEQRQAFTRTLHG